MSFASANLTLKVSFIVMLPLAMPMPIKESDTQLERRCELIATCENINVFRLKPVKDGFEVFDYNSRDFLHYVLYNYECIEHSAWAAHSYNVNV